MQTELVVAVAAFVAMFGMWVILPSRLRRRHEGHQAEK